MVRRISASDAKNNFGGLLELVAAHGRVEITKHGRVVAVMLAPRVMASRPDEETRGDGWGKEHMIQPDRARVARMVRPPKGFDEF